MLLSRLKLPLLGTARPRGGEGPEAALWREGGRAAEAGWVGVGMVVGSPVRKLYEGW